MLLHRQPTPSSPAPSDSEWLAPLCQPPAPSLAEACCCPAPARYQVLMPPTHERTRAVELLLCGHHYQVSMNALRDAGGWVYDDTGCLVAPPA